MTNMCNVHMYVATLPCEMLILKTSVNCDDTRVNRTVEVRPSSPIVVMSRVRLTDFHSVIDRPTMCRILDSTGHYKLARELIEVFLRPRVQR